MLTNKNKKIIIVFVILIVLSLPIKVMQYNGNKQDTRRYPTYYSHEDMSKARYEKMQTMLDSCVARKDTSGIRFLSNQLDAQLKIEDFFVFRTRFVAL